MRRGVVDGLAGAGVGPEFGAKFVPEEVDWHDVNSCESGYYNAAKQATAEVLRMGDEIGPG